MTSLFQKIEDAAVTGEQEVVKLFEEAWVEIENIWTADIEPILKAALQYIETNGAADLLKIAENAAISALATGGNVLDVLAATVGTVLDEAKSAGIQVAEGAAHLAVGLVLAKVQAAQTLPVPPETPPNQAA